MTSEHQTLSKGSSYVYRRRSILRDNPPAKLGVSKYW
jgi:hypothetical protein